MGCHVLLQGESHPIRTLSRRGSSTVPGKNVGKNKKGSALGKSPVVLGDSPDLEGRGCTVHAQCTHTDVPVHCLEHGWSHQ